MNSYRISTIAKQDLIRIYHYGVMKFGVQQADNYFNAFFDCFKLIAQQPFSFEAVDYIKPGYRRCICGADSIYYRIVENTVEIMTIIGRQDFK
jgi:toxin ParE1/3/4